MNGPPLSITGNEGKGYAEEQTGGLIPFVWLWVVLMRSCNTQRQFASREDKGGLYKIVPFRNLNRLQKCSCGEIYYLGINIYHGWGAGGSKNVLLRRCQGNLRVRMWETHLLSVEVGEEELLYQMIHDQRGEFVRLIQ